MNSSNALQRTAVLSVAGGLLIVALIWGGLEWSPQLRGASNPEATPLTLLSGLGKSRDTVIHPLLEILKLIASAMVGLIVAEFYRRSQPQKPVSRSTAQAQILLCVAGAMMMIIIGDSFARALGVLGGASIIRFRTPVEDPKDTVILFLLLGLGMSCGLGAFAVAGLGTVFLCVLLLFLEDVGAQKPRTMMLQLVSNSDEFPADHVRDVFQRGSVISWEPREIANGSNGTNGSALALMSMRYFVTLGPHTSLASLNADFTRKDSGIQSVSWEVPKRIE